jgi:hypothetical protein
MEQNIVDGLFGGLGGLTKSAFGAFKAYRQEPDTFKFDFKMFGVSVVEGIVGGIVIGAALPTPIAAFLGGAGLNSIADANDLFFPKKAIGATLRKK